VKGLLSDQYGQMPWEGTTLANVAFLYHLAISDQAICGHLTRSVGGENANCHSCLPRTSPMRKPCQASKFHFAFIMLNIMENIFVQKVPFNHPLEDSFSIQSLSALCLGLFCLLLQDLTWRSWHHCSFRWLVLTFEVVAHLGESYPFYSFVGVDVLNHPLIYCQYARSESRNNSPLMHQENMRPA
jgi:hypothetical protein